MGYRIEYDGQAGKYEVREEGKLLTKILLCVGTLAAVLCFSPENARDLRSFLIPGEDTVTIQAFHNMTLDLRSGASFGQALEAFCRFVIHGQ